MTFNPSKDIVFTSKNAEVKVTDLLSEFLNPGQTTISLNTMRSVFGSYVTINGSLSATGYSSYTTPITIQLGGDLDDDDIYANRWVEIREVSENEYEAKIKTGQGTKLFKEIGIASYLLATFKQLPEEYSFDSDAEDWTDVTPGDYTDFINGLVGSVSREGCTWDNLTLNDLVDIPVYLKIGTTEYTLTIVE